MMRLVQVRMDLMGKKRYYNYRDLPQYYEKVRQGSYIETQESYLSDTLIFGLRTLKGIHIETVNQRHGIDLLEKYKDIPKIYRFRPTPD